MAALSGQDRTGLRIQVNMGLGNDRHARESDVIRGVWEHKSDVAEGFTKKYGVHNLVYTEFHETMPDAILREKQIEKWRMAWKIDLIKQANPHWRDLYEQMLE